MAGDRVLLNIDAKADKALKEIERLKKRLDKANQSAGGMTKQFGSAGTALAKFAGPLAGILSVSTLVGSAIKEWEDRLDRARRSAGQLVDRLREAAGGAGALDDVPAMREAFSARQGIQSQARDVTAYRQFTEASPGLADRVGASSARGMALQAVGMSERASLIFGESGASSFTAVLGSLTDAGLDMGLAADVAARIMKETGAKAQEAAKAYVQNVRKVPGQELPLLNVVIAVAKGQQEVKPVVDKVVNFYLRGNRQGSIWEFFQRMNSATAGEQRGAVEAAQAQIPFSGSETRGQFFQQYSTAMSDPLTQRGAAIGRLARQRENLASASIAEQQEMDLRIGEFNLAADQGGGTLGAMRSAGAVLSRFGIPASESVNANIAFQTAMAEFRMGGPMTEGAARSRLSGTPMSESVIRAAMEEGLIIGAQRVDMSRPATLREGSTQ